MSECGWARQLRLEHMVQHYHLSVASNSRLPWFCISTLSDCFKQSLTNSRLLLSQSQPAPYAGYMYLFRVLIGSLDCQCLCFFRTASVITLGLVLRHSIENRSKARTQIKLQRMFFTQHYV